MNIIEKHQFLRLKSDFMWIFAGSNGLSDETLTAIMNP